MHAEKNNLKIVAGIDAGSTTTKALILDSTGKILSYHILNTGSAYWETVKECLSKALEASNLNWSNLNYVVATGYGRKLVNFANLELTEISCCAYGVAKVFPEVRMIIDIGGQDSKIIHVDRDGFVINFVLNDKCAAGTGRFLELIACSLGIPVEDLGKLAIRSTKIIEVSNVCAVFAESEVVSLRAAGADKADIVAGVCRAIARRIVGFVGQIGLKTPIVVCGGVAKNLGVIRALEEKLNTKVLVPREPQLMSALGAAIRGLEELGFLKVKVDATKLIL
ncbi:2-hydroxyglutaryl-CoA dehydratase [Candidatus Bathyarchaeota archaeon]|nr:MAG: 2-hydroxyglutaryl-CoA dehydratase [Candidatus Bathyarchaeota archaeon]